MSDPPAGTTALEKMTDVDMTLVVRAEDKNGNWRVGLFENFKINDKLSPDMVYVDGNIGKYEGVFTTYKGANISFSR